MISIQERRNNMYFRGGSLETTFEYGQEQNDAWSNMLEEEVLISRVKKGLKPFAQIVLQENNSTEDIISLAQQNGLIANAFVSAWGVPCVSIVCNPNVQLKSLFNEYQMTKFSVVENNINQLGQKMLHEYLNGCDLYLGHTPFEC